MRTADITTSPVLTCQRRLCAQCSPSLPHHPRGRLLVPAGSQMGNGGAERLDNFPTSRSSAGTLPRAVRVPQAPLYSAARSPALPVCLGSPPTTVCGWWGSATSPVCSRGPRAPAAALGTAASELNLRHLPAQSAFHPDSAAPALGPGPGGPQPRWLVGPRPPLRTEAGFTVVSKLSETLWAAFTPSLLLRQVEGYLRVTHSWFSAPWRLLFQPLLCHR